MVKLTIGIPPIEASCTTCVIAHCVIPNDSGNDKR